MAEVTAPGIDLVATMPLPIAASMVRIRYGQRCGIQLRPADEPAGSAAARSERGRRRGPCRLSSPGGAAGLSLARTSLAGTASPPRARGAAVERAWAVRDM